MDDIYEHRVQIQQETKFAHPGKYSFTLEQIMREDPLKHVLNVGVRIEKVPSINMSFKKKRLAVAIAVYWMLLAYIVVGLAWWFIELERQNRQISAYQRQRAANGRPLLSRQR
jgi:hypothetical protein